MSCPSRMPGTGFEMLTFFRIYKDDGSETLVYSTYYIHVYIIIHPSRVSRIASLRDTIRSTISLSIEAKKKGPVQGREANGKATTPNKT